MESFRAYFKVLFRGRKHASNEERRLGLSFMKSSAYLAFYFITTYFCAVIGGIVRLATDPELTSGCSGCQLTAADCGIQIASLLLGQLFMLPTLPFKVVKQVGTYSDVISHALKDAYVCRFCTKCHKCFRCYL